jgi:hypothetical protein
VTTIELPTLAAPVNELWHALLDLAAEYPSGWTLIGGQMVLLHAVEHGQVPPQISQDGDVVADVRLDRRALLHVVTLLERLGFRLSGISVEGLAHRYSREAKPRPVIIDLLAPDGLGSRVDLTTSPPGRTVQVSGATQALRRTEMVSVIHEGRHGHVPRPTLLAAIVIKAAAVQLMDPARHYRDLALLCALTADPFDLADQLTAKDRQRLRLAAALGKDSHPAWSLVPADLRTQGQIAFAILRSKHDAGRLPRS